MSSLKELQKYGQAVWLDYIRRSLITSGELHRLVEEDGLRGVTSNPTIFQKAIAGSSDYDDSLNELIKTNPHMDVRTLFDKLAIEDIQMAADILRPIYDGTKGNDGFVSLELPPDLARDTEGSITEARRLWKEVDRPNLMLKVPATAEGIPVIEALIAEGININITLIFSVTHYEDAAQAYIRGLERGTEPEKIASVASLFVSRIDTAVDKELEGISKPEALALRGKIAVANAKMAYKRFKEIFSGDRWDRLERKGARMQRLLWASTGTKNPSYSDVLYIEELIGQHTVNTMPPASLNAFRDHGNVRPTLLEGLADAQTSLTSLKKLNVDLDAVTEKLQIDGVNAFADSYNSLLTTLEEKCQAMIRDQIALRSMSLGEYQAQVDDRLKHWKKIDFNRRLWSKDPTLWFEKRARAGFVPEITDRLGWLVLPEIMHEKLEDLLSFTQKIRSEGIQYTVLIGMGGSSLAPEVYQKTFGNAEGYPELIVLDSTHPSAVRAVEKRVDLHHTLFLVSSKSGSTIEMLSLFRYFWERMGKVVRDRGTHFVAITDEGTPLMDLARERDFRRVFSAPPDVGGRYSALTVFGLLPAAFIGLEVHKLLDQAWIMSEKCAFCVPLDEASGLVLGAAVGEIAKSGRDKVTFLVSPSFSDFPVWLEQLIAESTGKEGKGIIPIVDEPLTTPENYKGDRLFVYLGEESGKGELDVMVKALEEAGHPVIRSNLYDKYNIGQEIFCWEMAIASAGSILRINPFNQPNVQMAKELAKKMMREAEKGIPSLNDGNTISADDPTKVTEAFKSWLDQATEGDYVCIQAYLQPSPEITEALQKLRSGLLDRLKLATTLGYGPRFLHSTGQLHKGGPNTGLFIQLIDEPKEDIKVPETNYTFNTLIQAQALGDYQALKKVGRRVLRINLKKDVIGNLSRLSKLISE